MDMKLPPVIRLPLETEFTFQIKLSWGKHGGHSKKGTHFQILREHVYVRLYEVCMSIRYFI